MNSNLSKKQNNSLKKLPKMRSEFLAIAAHQMRTQISIIRGNVALLLENLDQKVPPKIKKICQNIDVKAKNLTQIVSDIFYALELNADDYTLKNRNLK